MGIYQAQPEIMPGDEQAEFKRQQAAILARRFERSTPIFSRVLVGCFIAVFLFQLFIGGAQSIEAAGLVKPLVWQGEFWRLLTSATLHLPILPLGLLHIYFNSQALYNVGATIEALSRRAHVAICFVLAAIGGSLASLYLMPETQSVGASGGIMGLFGFLGVYGFRNRRHLPPNFTRDIIFNLLFIAAVGYVGYEVIDNAAHGGGLVVGAIYGLLTSRRNEAIELQKSNVLFDVLGYASLLLVAAAALFSIFRILSFNQTV